MNIAVAGTGYVGLSLATLLSQKNSVTAVDIIEEKVKALNEWKSPIQDEYIEKYFSEAKSGDRSLDLHAVWNNGQEGSDNPSNAVYADANFVVIAAPTNYDSQKNFFDTSAVESVIKQVMVTNDHCFMIIKSTIPVGYTVSVQKKYNTNRILFSPEFLRESKALYDNLYPSRIIVGWDESDPEVIKASETFANLLKEAAFKKMSKFFTWASQKQKQSSCLLTRISLFVLVTLTNLTLMQRRKVCLHAISSKVCVWIHVLEIFTIIRALAMADTACLKIQNSSSQTMQMSRRI